MKTVLVILTQANLMQAQSNESLSATMVLATFGCQVKVLLKDAALSLLKNDLVFDASLHAFKFGSNMVDSFEFYDLTPLYVEQHNQDHRFVKDSQHEIEFVTLNSDFIQQFEHVLYW